MKNITAHGISSMSTQAGGGLQLRARATDGPAGAAGRSIELSLDQGNLDWLLSHLAMCPQYGGAFRAIAGELTAMEAVRNDPGASVIARMNARPGDISAYNRMLTIIRRAREAQEARKEGS